MGFGWWKKIKEGVKKAYNKVKTWVKDRAAPAVSRFAHAIAPVLPGPFRGIAEGIATGADFIHGGPPEQWK
jgi:hypothetical protein